MHILSKFYNFFTINERKNSIFILGLVIISSLLDAAGVASIFPFMGVLANPSLVDNNLFLNFLYKNFKFTNKKDFLFFLGILFTVLFLLILIFKAFCGYLQLRFISKREFTIGKTLLNSYLKQPFVWYLNKNTTQLSKNIINEVNQVIINSLNAIIIIIAQSFVVFVITIVLFFVDYKLAILTVSFLLTLYLIIYFFTKPRLKRISEKRLHENEKRFSVISEVFGAIKEVKLYGLEEKYINEFSYHANNYADYHSAKESIANIPRYAFEGIAFSGIMFVLLYLMKGANILSALPIVSLYAFAGYRLMPALQQIYVSITNIKYVSPSLNIIYNEFVNLQKINNEVKNSDINLSFEEVKFSNISFKYPETEKYILSRINFEIKKFQIIGFVGTTGSGKTTLIDILLGLLNPEEGELLVNGSIVTNLNRRSWQNILGYVPQQIYIVDSTIAENIAFGLKLVDIDYHKLEHVCKIANIYDFITEELPLGFKTKVGERGIKLSGGQRQRIGIARALYNDPQVLIFDEATNALDNLTEQLVIDAISKLKNNITIIMIAHRLNTIKNCDNIFLLDNGIIKASGPFDDVILSNHISKSSNLT